MEQLGAFAYPSWVNILILVPVGAYFAWRKRGLQLGAYGLLWTAIFAIAFGLLEAAVVINLRAIAGLAAGAGGTLEDVIRISSEPARIFGALPKGLLMVEILREAFTIIMLMSAAFLGARARRERWALFLWMFAIWDFVYYAGLWTLIGWPSSLLSPDILFLIPVAWVSRVWFPIAIDLATIIAVLASLQRSKAQ